MVICSIPYKATHNDIDSLNAEYKIRVKRELTMGIDWFMPKSAFAANSLGTSPALAQTSHIEKIKEHQHSTIERWRKQKGIR